MKHFRISRLAWALVALVGLSACGTTGDGRLADLPLSDVPLNGKFVWHDLITNDVAAVKSFYGTLFGWSFEDTEHPNGGDYVLISKDEVWIGGIVYMEDPSDADYSRWLGYMSVPDVDRAVKQATSAGGSVALGPLNLGEVGRAAAIMDPQQAVVGIIRSRLGDPDDSIEPALGHLVWDELIAADTDAAAEFYRKISAAQVNSVERAGMEYAVLSSHGRHRAGFLQRADESIDPFWLTHVAVTDPAAMTRRVAELGGAVVLAPDKEIFNGAVAVVTDPTGAVLALHQWPLPAEAK